MMNVNLVLTTVINMLHVKIHMVYLVVVAMKDILGMEQPAKVG